MVHGMLLFYEVYQIRPKCDVIQAPWSASRDLKKLLEVADQGDRAVVGTAESALNRVQGLYLALDSLGIQE